MDIVHQMLTRFYDGGVYNVLYTYPDAQAYRKGRFTGLDQASPRRPGRCCSRTRSPTYATLKPVAATSGGERRR